MITLTRTGQTPPRVLLPNHISHCILASKLIERTSQVQLPSQEEQTLWEFIKQPFNRFVNRFSNKPYEADLEGIISSIQRDLDSSVSKEELRKKIEITEKPHFGSQASYDPETDEVKVSKNHFFALRSFLDPFQLGYLDKLPKHIKNFLGNEPTFDPELSSYHEYMHRLQTQFVKGLTYGELDEVTKELKDYIGKQFEPLKKGKIASFLIGLGVKQDSIDKFLNQGVDELSKTFIDTYKPYCCEKREAELSPEQINLKKKLLLDFLKAMFHGNPLIMGILGDGLRSYISNPCEIEARIAGASVKLKDIEEELNSLDGTIPQNKELAKELIAKAKTCKREIRLNLLLAEIESLRSAGAPEKEIKRKERELVSLANDISKQSLTSSYLKTLFRTKLRIL